MVNEEYAWKLAIGEDCDHLQLPIGHEWADKMTQLHEFGHAALDLPERDEAFRRYKKKGHHTLEEEALAWALVLRWTNCPGEVRAFVCDQPPKRLVGYVQYWMPVSSERGGRLIAREWLAQAEACIDEAFKAGTWPSSACWLEGR